MTTFSFELYPPRSGPAELELYRSVDHLVAAGPEFVSVTYGANGSTRGRSLRILRYLLEKPGVAPMAHLTCVGTTYQQTKSAISDFLDVGITSFLALRGDPPEGIVEGEDFLGDLGSASELVQLIHSVQAAKEPFSERPIQGFPGASRLARREKVTIAVAAFPNGHARSRSITQDLDILLAKQAAGANLAITQLFFHADDYLSFVDQARSAGVTMRILPGIMPVLSPKRLKRVLELSGESAPAALDEALKSAPDAEAQATVGINFATQLCADLLAGGATGLHIYTFNQHEAPLAVLRGAGCLGASSLGADALGADALAINPPTQQQKVHS